MPDPFSMNQDALPVPLGVSFWKGEIDRADRADKPFHSQWDTNVQWYRGESPDAAQSLKDGVEHVNVNVDFYQVEQKQAQLFHQLPDVQMSAQGMLAQQSALIAAHRALINALLGEDAIDVLPTVKRSIKNCLCVSGTGPVIVGYEPWQKPAPPTAMQPGSMLGLNQLPAVTLYDKLLVDSFSMRKLLVPADFTDTDWDNAPWLAMRFRMPLVKARKTFGAKIPETFTGNVKADDHVVDAQSKPEAITDQPYCDGVLVWYRASVYEDVHPELYRELVLIDGIENEVRHRDSPHQVLLPNGKLSGDSLIGNPIHPLTIRTVPDSHQVPSDSQMTRPLVRELCKFRTQMVQERDANRQRTAYDSDKVPPDVLAKIVNGTTGSLIGLEGGALAAGIGSIFAPITTSTPHRENYIANDYITKDIEKTLAIDASGAGVTDNEKESATKTATVDRNRNVRMADERLQILRWYIKLVQKVSALALRYLSPQTVASYIGQEQAGAWAQLQQFVKNGADQRLAFRVRPNSQLHIDANDEYARWKDVYQFTAKDPNAIRARVLRKLFEAAGENADEFVVDQIPDQKPDGSFAFSAKAEDLVAPQGQMVLEVLAQLGIQISQQAKDQAATELFKQVSLGIRDASGKPVPTATSKPQEHGGTADQVRPLSKQSADQSGQRSGPKTKEAA